MRALFGLDACHPFPQHVLAIIPLIVGVQVHGQNTCFQEGTGSSWLLVEGPEQAGAEIGTRSQDPWFWQFMHTPGTVKAVTCTCSQDPQWWQHSLSPLESEMATVAHSLPIVHSGSALPQKKLLWWSCPSPHVLLNNSTLHLWWAQDSSQTSSVVL